MNDIVEAARSYAGIWNGKGQKSMKIALTHSSRARNMGMNKVGMTILKVRIR